MKRVGLFVMALFVAVPAFAQPSITGTWDVTITGPQGPNTVKVDFKQEGDKVTGLFKSPNGELPFNNGASITGNDLKFSFTISFQGTPLEIVMTGKVAGDTMDGKADFGGFVEGTWNGKRASDAAPSAAPAPAAAAAKAGGATGSWDVMFKTPQGDFPASAVLTDEGGVLKGSITSQMGEAPITGTMTGNMLKLEMKSQTPQGEMSVAMSAELQGDTFVKGVAEIAGMGTFEWTAKRKQ